jgi:hypothetical protein
MYLANRNRRAIIKYYFALHNPGIEIVYSTFPDEEFTGISWANVDCLDHKSIIYIYIAN